MVWRSIRSEFSDNGASLMPPERPFGPGRRGGSKVATRAAVSQKRGRLVPRPIIARAFGYATRNRRFALNPTAHPCYSTPMPAACPAIHHPQPTIAVPFRVPGKPLSDRKRLRMAQNGPLFPESAGAAWEPRRRADSSTIHHPPFPVSPSCGGRRAGRTRWSRWRRSCSRPGRPRGRSPARLARSPP